MPDLLFSEYRRELANAGARFCCDTMLAGHPDSRSWTNPLGGMYATISLTSSGTRENFLVPRVQTSISIGGEGLVSAVILADAQATLQRALSCLAMLRDVRVWLSDCPCSRCSARGTVSGSPCPTCNGTGKRQEASDEVA